MLIVREVEMDTDDVDGSLEDLAESTWALAVVSASVESGLLAALACPCRVDEAAEAGSVPVELAQPMLDVLVALGFVRRLDDRYVAVDGLRSNTDAGVEQLRAELRTTLLQGRDLVDRAARHTLTAGWVHTDPDLVEAQGASGRAAARMMAEQGVLRLPGLSERLSAPTASFLDVGIGVGVISIEMCRAHPALHVVGLEPAGTPRRQAIQRIADAGLSDRIEIRANKVEELTDVESSTGCTCRRCSSTRTPSVTAWRPCGAHSAKAAGCPFLSSVHLATPSARQCGDFGTPPGAAKRANPMTWPLRSVKPASPRCRFVPSAAAGTRS